MICAFLAPHWLASSIVWCSLPSLFPRALFVSWTRWGIMSAVGTPPHWRARSSGLKQCRLILLQSCTSCHLPDSLVTMVTYVPSATWRLFVHSHSFVWFHFNYAAWMLECCTAALPAPPCLPFDLYLILTSAPTLYEWLLSLTFVAMQWHTWGASYSKLNE